MSLRYRFLIFTAILFAGFASCKKEYTPKPRGYYRISFPEHSYTSFSKTAPFSFSVPTYAHVEDSKIADAEPYWYTLSVPEHHAEIHISYKKVDDNLGLYLEDARTMAYKHAIKANSIEPDFYYNDENNVFGVIYQIKGNTASPMQFVLTDSVQNFLRGALYFREVPNIDSIQPSIDFFQEDVMELIRTTKWRSEDDSL